MNANHDINEFKEFKDYILLQPGEMKPDIKSIVYLKVFNDYDKTIYLGSLRFGLYQCYNTEKLNDFIQFILDSKFPTYKAYELEVTNI